MSTHHIFLFLHYYHQKCFCNSHVSSLDLCCLWGLIWTVPTVSSPCCLWVTACFSPAEGLWVSGGASLCWESKRWPFVREVHSPSLAKISIIFRGMFVGRPSQMVLGSSRIGVLDLQSLTSIRTSVTSAADVQGWKTGVSVFICSCYDHQRSVDYPRCTSQSLSQPSDSGHPGPAGLAGSWNSWFAQAGRILSLFEDPWSPQAAVGGTQPPVAALPGQSPQLLTSPCSGCRKVQQKYHGTDGTCSENVVYKDTLHRPYVLNYLCISKNMILECIYIYIYNWSSYSQFLKLSLKIIKIAFLVKK